MSHIKEIFKRPCQCRGCTMEAVCDEPRCREYDYYKRGWQDSAGRSCRLLSILLPDDVKVKTGDTILDKKDFINMFRRYQEE